MRKIEYAILVHILKQEIADARRVADSSVDIGLRIAAQTTENVLVNVAREFAKRAAVDGFKFLKACGL